MSRRLPTWEKRINSLERSLKRLRIYAEQLKQDAEYHKQIAHEARRRELIYKKRWGSLENI